MIKHLWKMHTILIYYIIFVRHMAEKVFAFRDCLHCSYPSEYTRFPHILLLYLRKWDVLSSAASCFS